MTRQQKIWLFGSISFIGFSYLGYRSIKRKQVYDILVDKIAKNSLTGNNKKAIDVLTGLHHKQINATKSFVVLPESDKRKIAEAIYEAVDGFGTDEVALESEFRSLKDKVAISQVASFYKNKYGETLYDRIVSENELSKVIAIVNSKPDVRWL